MFHYSSKLLTLAFAALVAISAEQIFAGFKVPNPSISNDNGTLQNKGKRSGFCMDQAAGNTALGANLTMSGCNGGVNQKFTANVDSGHIQILNGNLCVEVSGGNGGSGTAVVQNVCDSNKSNQKWQFSHADLSIRPSYDTSLCLDVNGASTNDGAQVIVFTCNNAADQTWSFQ